MTHIFTFIFTDLNTWTPLNLESKGTMIYMLYVYHAMVSNLRILSDLHMKSFLITRHSRQ